MKAGIITFGSAHNYGALLQAWALQKYLEGEGLEVDVINYRPQAIDNVYDIYRLRRVKADDPARWRRFKKRVQVRFGEPWRIEKRNSFERFISNELNVTETYRTFEELQAADLEYDFLFAGSDQIWNTDLTKGFDPSYFLDFGNEDAVRVAYAASLGRDEIDSVYERDYREYLENYDYISVREQSMLPIFGALTDRDIKVACDPTLLIERDDFDALKKTSAYAGREYIYAHQIMRENAVVDLADTFSEKLGIPTLHNRKEGSYINELDFLYRESPAQLLSVVENAQLVISNSFHLTILAMIYHRPFITVPHAKRPERMNALLENVGLEKNLVEDVRIMAPYDTLEIDYGPVDLKLSSLRDDSRRWLEGILQAGKAI